MNINSSIAPRPRRRNHFTPEKAPALVPFLLNDKEVWFTFRCTVCGQPILPKDGNVLLYDGKDASNGPVTIIEGQRLRHFLGTVAVVHKQCDKDRSASTSWFPLNRILNSNQNIFRAIAPTAGESL